MSSSTLRRRELRHSRTREFDLEGRCRSLGFRGVCPHAQGGGTSDILPAHSCGDERRYALPWSLYLRGGGHRGCHRRAYPALQGSLNRGMGRIKDRDRHDFHVDGIVKDERYRRSARQRIKQWLQSIDLGGFLLYISRDIILHVCNSAWNIEIIRRRCRAFWAAHHRLSAAANRASFDHQRHRQKNLAIGILECRLEDLAKGILPVADRALARVEDRAVLVFLRRRLALSCSSLLSWSRLHSDHVLKRPGKKYLDGAELTLKADRSLAFADHLLAVFLRDLRVSSEFIDVILIDAKEKIADLRREPLESGVHRIAIVSNCR